MMTMKELQQVRAFEESTGRPGTLFRPATPNKFRQFCELKGIRGKGKKKLRRALAERASAKNARAIDPENLEGMVK